MESRNQSYKKSSNMDKKRLLRVHRRSIDQREMRHEEMNRRRQIEDMSPIESREHSRNASAAGTPVRPTAAALSRLEKLKKWKEEKELKRKLEAMEKARSKPGFQFKHLAHDDKELFQRQSGSGSTIAVGGASAAVSSEPAKRPAKAASQTGKRAGHPLAVPAVSRQSRSASKPTAPTQVTATKRPALASKQQSAKTTTVQATGTRTGRSRGARTGAAPSTSPPPAKKMKGKEDAPRKGGFMAPTAASKSRATAAGAAAKKAVSAGPATGADRRPRSTRAAATTGAKHAPDTVTTQRSVSGDQTPESLFAPSGFVFEAPGALQSFVFKPLSPSSTASFLFLGNEANNTTMSAFSSRLERTSTPRRNTASLVNKSSGGKMEAVADDEDDTLKSERPPSSVRSTRGSQTAEVEPKGETAEATESASTDEKEAGETSARLRQSRSRRSAAIATASPALPARSRRSRLEHTDSGIEVVSMVAQSESTATEDSSATVVMETPETVEVEAVAEEDVREVKVVEEVKADEMEVTAVMERVEVVAEVEAVEPATEVRMSDTKSKPAPVSGKKGKRKASLRSAGPSESEVEQARKNMKAESKNVNALFSPPVPRKGRGKKLLPVYGADWEDGNAQITQGEVSESQLSAEKESRKTPRARRSSRRGSSATASVSAPNDMEMPVIEEAVAAEEGVDVGLRQEETKLKTPRSARRRGRSSLAQTPSAPAQELAEPMETDTESAAEKNPRRKGRPSVQQPAQEEKTAHLETDQGNEEEESDKNKADSDASETRKTPARSSRPNRRSQAPSKSADTNAEMAQDEEKSSQNDGEPDTAAQAADHSSRSSSIRKSRRSHVTASLADPETVNDKPASETAAEQAEANNAEQTSKGRRKSRRSVAPSSVIGADVETHIGDQDLTSATDGNERVSEELDAKRRRKSRRSHAPPSSAAGEEPVKDNLIEKMEAESTDAAQEPLNGRSIASCQQDSTENDVFTDNNKAAPAKSVDFAVLGSPEVGKLRSGLRAKDDLFLTPGPPPSSAKRSARRRRTAAMIALSSASSPEEAIKIISNSPMVELTRRTPKSKISPEMRKNSTASLFDDVDFTLEPTQLLSALNASEDTVFEDAAKCDTSPASITQETAPSTQAAVTVEAAAADSESEPREGRDVEAFRERLNTETAKLNQLSDHWKTVIEPTSGLTEEVEGEIRSVALKAVLLTGRKGKFHQFADLVEKCEAGDPATTPDDLQGFWDMIFIQAEEIYAQFTDLETLQKNDWKPVEPAIPQPTKKIVKKATAAVGAVKKSKPKVQSKFAAFRAQLKQSATESVSSEPTEEKVFDAGFFKVNSPVRSPKFHCQAGTPCKRKSEEHEHGEQCRSTTTTTTTGTTTTPMADKENVAQRLIRRSLGAGSARRSFVPAVPSPLLKDGAAGSSPVRPTAAKSPDRKDCDSQDGSVDTPVRNAGRRRSSRRNLRKSVCFAEEVKEAEDSGSSEQEVDLSAYFQPSTSQSTSPLKESAVDNSPMCFEDILRHGKPVTPACIAPQPPSARRKSALKLLPSAERRRSRRSVAFALSPQPAGSTGTGSPAPSLPSTPYNRDSLVAGRRVSHRHNSVSDDGNLSVLEELKSLAATPPLRRSARPSLLYTPPQNEENDDSESKTPSKDVPVAQLISFTP